MSTIQSLTIRQKVQVNVDGTMIECEVLSRDKRSRLLSNKYQARGMFTGQILIHWHPVLNCWVKADRQTD